MSMTCLIRKCNSRKFDGTKCPSVMIVEVGAPKKVHSYDNQRNLIEEVELFGVYDDVECIEGCFLGFTLCGKIFHLPTINRTSKRAVYCSNCHAVRYLRLFKELQV